MEQLGNNGDFYYARFPKSDGGYDYRRFTGGYPTGNVGVGGADLFQPFSLSEADTYKELGVNPTDASAYNTASGGGTTDNSQLIGSVNSAIGRLGAQQASGNQSIDTSYQDALNQLLGAKNVGERNYGQAKQTSATGYVGAKNTIGSQAGSSLNGLLRLLGSRGAGGGSAYNISAPQAVTRGASLQRADVANTFGQNQQALDTNWGDYLNQYNNQVASAGSQRDRGKQDLERSIETNRASLLRTLASLQTSPGASQPYLDQANQLLDRTANYSVAPVTQNLSAYQAPSIASYTTRENPTPQYNGAGPSDYFSPYLQSLLGKKQQPQFA